MLLRGTEHRVRLGEPILSAKERAEIAETRGGDRVRRTCELNLHPKRLPIERLRLDRMIRALLRRRENVDRIRERLALLATGVPVLGYRAGKKAVGIDVLSAIVEPPPNRHRLVEHLLRSGAV